MIIEPPTSSVSIDMAHGALLAGVILSAKPKRILELGYGNGYASDLITQAIRWNQCGELTIVDNWEDTKGLRPEIRDSVDPARILEISERDFLKTTPGSSFDLIVSDADHLHAHQFIPEYFRIASYGGFIFFHDVLNPSFPKMQMIVDYVRDRRMTHFLFSESSRDDESCNRGWLMVQNFKSQHG